MGKKGWVEILFSAILESLESGKRPKGGVQNILSGIPSIGAEHLNSTGGFDFSKIKYVPTEFANNMKKGVIKRNDIIIVKDGATTGKTSFVGDNFPFETAVVNEHVFICRIHKLLDPKYVFYYLYSREGMESILLDFRGAAQGGISTSFASLFKIPLAPLKMQNRISRKLDKIFNHLEVINPRVERIPDLINAFKENVLTKAVTGRLTNLWREINKGESAKKLCDEVIKSRTNNSNNNKKKGLSINLREDLELFEIPSSWCWVDLEFLFDEEDSFCYGVVQPGKEVHNGPKLIRVKDIDKWKVVHTELRTISENINNLYKRSKVKAGNLLLTVVGTIGRTALVTEAENNYNIARAVAKLPIRNNFNSEFVNIYLNSIQAQKWLLGDTREVARKTLNLDQLRTLPIILPPRKEQDEIVRVVNALFATTTKIEKHHDRINVQLENLPLETLAKAFKGELVNQNKDDAVEDLLMDLLKSKIVNNEN